MRAHTAGAVLAADAPPGHHLDLSSITERRGEHSILRFTAQDGTAALAAAFAFIVVTALVGA